MKSFTTDLEKIPWVDHGFFTRLGGEPDNVLTLKQTHSATAVVASKPWADDKKPEGDAIVTNIEGLVIGVVTADCTPVLLASKKARVVAAVHAGWKGALGGVLESAIAEMVKLGAVPADIMASVGPCIRQASYEVTLDFKAPFLAQDSANDAFFVAGRDDAHLMFDLAGYVRHRLTTAGIKKIFDTAQDTLSNEGLFYSYRRATLKGQKNDGRQLSIIAINP